MCGKITNSVENHLSEVFGKKVQITNLQTLGGGCINHTSQIDTNLGSYFLKWNSNCNADIFLREAESLNELELACSNALKIPKVIAVKEVDSTPGFLVLEYLPSARLSANSDEKLGRGLAQMHKYKSHKFGFYSDNYCGATIQNNIWEQSWVTFFRDKRLRFLLHLIQQQREISIDEMNVYERLLNRLPELIPKDASPVLIHGDLWSGNYMMTKFGPALIDPAAYYADREMEFAIITMFGGFSSRFFSAYNEVHPLESDWQNRNQLYQLYHVLNHYYLFGGHYRHQALLIAKKFM